MAISTKDTIFLGLNDFWTRKVRSIVTLFGVVLGTMSVIVILSLTNGIRIFSKQMIMQNGGLDKIKVRSDWRYRPVGKQLKRHFSDSEINYIRENLPDGCYLNPSMQDWPSFKVKDNFSWGRMIGTLPEYLKIYERKVAKGRFFSDFDYKSRNSVVVLGSTIASELFGSRNPVGQSLDYRGLRLKIIGVMEELYLKRIGDNIEGGSDNALERENRRAFIPISTMSKKAMRVEIRNFEVKANNVYNVEEIARELDSMLLNMRFGEPVFLVESNAENLQEQLRNLKIFEIVFGIISGISLLVAGIVIMNIMLSSVNERTREIGIRLTCGARRRDVFSQFLIQTIVTTTVGGIIGVGIGYLLLNQIEAYLKFPMEMSLHIAIIGIIVSSITGLFFGLLPAVRASNMDPVKALRYE